MARLTDPNPTENVELLSGQYQGDMVLNLKQWAEVEGILPRTGLINETYRWINNTVPYELSDDFSKLFSILFCFKEIMNIISYFIGTTQKAHILLGLADIENRTCIKFVPKNDDHVDYISVIVSNVNYTDEQYYFFLYIFVRELSLDVGLKLVVKVVNKNSI